MSNLYPNFSTCPECDLLTLGNYAKSVDYEKNGRKVEVGKWISSKHNMGMAFDRETWNKVMTCAKQFCAYDDYNWDWSLQYISNNCFERPLKTMAVLAPRLVSIDSFSH